MRPIKIDICLGGHEVAKNSLKSPLEVLKEGKPKKPEKFELGKLGFWSLLLSPDRKAHELAQPDTTIWICLLTA